MLAEALGAIALVGVFGKLAVGINPHVGQRGSAHRRRQVVVGFGPALASFEILGRHGVLERIVLLTGGRGGRLGSRCGSFRQRTAWQHHLDRSSPSEHGAVEMRQRFPLVVTRRLNGSDTTGRRRRLGRLGDRLGDRRLRRRATNGWLEPGRTS